MKTLLPALALSLVALVPQDASNATAKSDPRPTVGQAAPQFRLNDHTGKAVAPLAEEADEQLWTVLAFYPKAMTAG